MGVGALITSSTVAASATVRVSAPLVDRPCHPGTVAATRPRLGLSPTSPQHDAGMRMEPPPSLAWATGNIPEATAAAAPPLDPPGVWSTSHGLRVAPYRLFSVTVTEPNSGVLVLPVRMKPARTRASATGALVSSGRSDAPGDP